MGQVCSVVDLGTNTFQLLVAEPLLEFPGICILHQSQVPVTLGKGAMETGQIQPDAMQRAIQALTNFKEKALELGSPPSQIMCVGTSILRRATNAQELLSHIETMGMRAQVISGLQEADFIHAGIIHSLPEPWAKCSLVMDIGGGSVEFILFEGTKVHFKISLEVGGLRLLSLFHVNGLYDPELNPELDAFIEKELAPVWQACARFRPEVLIGAAGAFETIWDLEHAGSVGELIPPSDLLDLTQFHTQKKLVENTESELRKLIPGMKAFRAGILPYANALIAMVLEKTGILELRVSSFSLKEGYWFSQQGRG